MRMLSPCPDGLAANFVVDRGRAEEMFDRRYPAHHFLRGVRQEVGVALETRHGLRILDQGKQAAGNRSARRVVARARESDVVRIGFKILNRPPVDLGRCDDRCHIVLRILPPLPRDVLEVIDIGDGGVDQVRALLHVGVAATEIGLRDLEKALLRRPAAVRESSSGPSADSRSRPHYRNRIRRRSQKAGRRCPLPKRPCALTSVRMWRG